MQLWRELQLCDELGFDYGFCVEHHFNPNESWMPSPSIYCAAAAAHTTRLRIGSHNVFREHVTVHRSTNAGEEPRSLAKVASGGELSRIALAIAVTTSQLAHAEGAASTLIFDEIDAGVGGAVAETVGRMMKQLGKDRQVLAVTHLPQVAACADHHLVVSKRAQDGGVASRVTPVTGEQRISEVARMLGGEKLSGTTLAHAREMLESQAPATRAPRKVRS